jgi:hypothetical protein
VDAADIHLGRLLQKVCCSYRRCLVKAMRGRPHTAGKLCTPKASQNRIATSWIRGTLGENFYFFPSTKAAASLSSAA